MTPFLVLVVPCYNEAERLQPASFRDFLASHEAVRLLFVDDGSRDGTFDVQQGIREAAPGRVSILRMPSNRGKGEAVRLGILEGIQAGAGIVGFWDADLATPLDAVDDFLAVAAKRPDIEILLGSRVRLMGRDIRRQHGRHYLGRVFATAVSLSLDLPVYDTQCGAKLFRVTRDTASVFERPFHSPWIFDVEALARYLALPAGPGERPREARIYEVAVRQWHHVPGSKLHWFDYIRSFFELMAIHHRYRRRAVRRAAAGGRTGPGGR